MLYYLFEYLDKILDVPGTGVFQYITFRSALALMLSLLLSTIYGKRIIRFLQRQQVGETVRELGLAGQNEKAGTPTIKPNPTCPKTLNIPFKPALSFLKILI